MSEKITIDEAQAAIDLVGQDLLNMVWHLNLLDITTHNDPSTNLTDILMEKLMMKTLLSGTQEGSRIYAGLRSGMVLVERYYSDKGVDLDEHEQDHMWESMRTMMEQAAQFHEVQPPLPSL